MKISISSICKNEEKFISNWLDCFKQADEIIVCDTGSTDNSVNVLKSHNIKVVEKTFDPFYFDEARNYSLSLVDSESDWVIAPDFDEILNDNWRQNLEQIINENPEATSIRCKTMILKNNQWKEYEEGNKKIFKNKIYSWHQHIHEYLKCSIKETEIFTDKIVLYHFVNNEKLKNNMYVKICLDEYEKDKTNSHVLRFIIFHYYENKQFDKFIPLAIDYIKMLEKDDYDTSDICTMISTAYFYINNKMCIKYAMKAIEINPSEKNMDFFINLSIELKFHEMTLFGIALSNNKKYQNLRSRISSGIS